MTSIINNESWYADQMQRIYRLLEARYDRNECKKLELQVETAHLNYLMH